MEWEVGCTRFVATMKTNPIGVRFRVDILEKLKTEHNAETPQKALNFLERFFVTHHALTNDLKQPLRSSVERSMPPTANKILDDANKEIHDKIAEIEKELKSPPKNILIGERTWRRVREQRIQELKNQLK